MNDEGFVTHTVLGQTTLTLPASVAALEEAMAFARERGIVEFNLSLRAGGPTLESLLPYASEVRSLSVSGDGSFEPTLLESFEALRSFSNSVRKVRVDISRLVGLREYGGRWDRTTGLERSSELRSVAIYGYNQKDLRGLKLPRKLRRLRLVHSGLEEVGGTEDLPEQLERIDVEYARRLSVVNLSAESSVVELWVSTAGKAKYVPGATRLRSLRLCDCAPISSLSFLSSYDRLEDFRFVGTKIVDRDLWPIVKHSTIRWVGMTNVRGYSHTQQQVDAALRRRGGYAIWHVDDQRCPFSPSLLPEDG